MFGIMVSISKQVKEPIIKTIAWVRKHMREERSEHRKAWLDGSGIWLGQTYVSQLVNFKAAEIATGISNMLDPTYHGVWDKVWEQCLLQDGVDMSEVRALIVTQVTSVGGGWEKRFVEVFTTYPMTLMNVLEEPMDKASELRKTLAADILLELEHECCLRERAGGGPPMEGASPIQDRH